MITTKMIMLLSEKIIENHDLKLGKLFTKELYRHSGHVAYISISLAQKFNMNSVESTEVGIGGYLHDIGKLKIPTEILNKPSRLNADEWNIMMQHPRLGKEILNEHNFSQVVNDIVIGHHKKIDGSGYPSEAGNPSLYTQIVTVADIFDSIHTKRCYHSSKTIKETIDTMREMPGLNTLVINVLMEMLDMQHNKLSENKEIARKGGYDHHDLCIELGRVSCGN